MKRHSPCTPSPGLSVIEKLLSWGFDPVMSSPRTLLAAVALLMAHVGFGQELAVRTNYHALVLHYNPHVWKNGEYLTVQQAYQYRDVDALCRDYIAFLKKASGGQVNFSVAHKFVLDEFPPDNDPNVSFTPDNYDQLLAQHYDMWDHGHADYLSICNDPRFQIVPRVEAGEVDAVWVFPPCNCGFWETAMAGQGAFYVNGGAYPQVNCSRKFVLYGFGIEPHQGVGFMLENTAHMAEVLLRAHIATDWPATHRITGWNTLNLMNPNRAVTTHDLNDWDYFTVADAVHWDASLVAPGQSQAGLSHFPPPTAHNYGWSAVVLNFDGFWEAGRFQSFAGTFGLREGLYWASAGHKALLQAEFNLRDEQGSYPVLTIINDADIETGIRVSSQAPSARAGVLFRCSALSSGENAGRGYLVAVNPSQHRIELARLNDSYTVLAAAPAAVSTGVCQEVFITLRGPTIRVALSSASEPILIYTNLVEFADGGVGFCTYGSEAFFTHLNVTPVVRNYAESWRTYPQLTSTARTLTAAAWQGDDQPYSDMDYWYAWWYEHLPKNPGIHELRQPATGQLLGYALNSWWPYIFDLNVFNTPFLPTTNVLSATPDTAAPAMPANVRAAPLTPTTARVEWEEPPDNIGVTRYEVYRDGQLWRETPLRYLVDTRLTPATTYAYAVQACDGSGNESGLTTALAVRTFGADELLGNGSFETGLGLPFPWRPEALNAGADLVWCETGTGRNGSRCLSIEAGTNRNDARWVQELTGLVPRGRYLLSGWIKGQDIAVDAAAATGAGLWSLGAFGTEEYSAPALSGTFDWTRVQGYVHADANGRLVVGCRLGYWQQLAGGKAWFDDLALEYAPPPALPVAGWGTEAWSQSHFPEGLTNAIALACGNTHNLALTADGTVLAWGYNGSGQLFIPAGLSHVVAIAAGDAHSLALKSDGTIAAWGENAYGQSDVPAALTNVLGLTAGSRFSVALLSEGTVTAWGANDGEATSVPAGLADVTAVAAGYEFALALKGDGTVAAWGTLGRTHDNPHPASVPEGLNQVIAIACGASHALALKADGTVVAWGDSYWGETNVPPGLNRVIAIAAGMNHSLALRADGAVVGWGGNQSGQLNVPAGATNAFAIGGGAYRSVALLGNTPPVFSVRPKQVAYTAAGFHLSFPSRRAGSYFLLYKDSLEDPVWVLARGLVAQGGLSAFDDPPPGLPRRFYVIRTAPRP